MLYYLLSEKKIFLIVEKYWSVLCSNLDKQTTFDDAGSKEAEDTTISPEVEVIESEELTESKVEVKEEPIDNVKEEWDADDVPDNWEETMDHKRDKELAELTGISGKDNCGCRKWHCCKS